MHLERGQVGDVGKVRSPGTDRDRQRLGDEAAALADRTDAPNDRCLAAFAGEHDDRTGVVDGEASEPFGVAGDRDDSIERRPGLLRLHLRGVHAVGPGRPDASDQVAAGAGRVDPRTQLGQGEDRQRGWTRRSGGYFSTG